MPSNKYKVKIIGVGPGARDYLLPIAKKSIEDADCLVGSERLLSLFRSLGKKEFPIICHLDKAVSYIKKYKDKQKIVVLVSGDPGFYSFLNRLSLALGKTDYAVIPGISTVSLAFARIKESWHDAKILSLHGKLHRMQIKNLANELKEAPKAFLLTDNNYPVQQIAQCLLDDGLENRKVVVLENLAAPNERIVRSDLKRLSKTRGFGLCAMILMARQKKPKNKGKLYGIGIGPGDPGLLTLKAKEVLDRADVIFVPKGNEDGSSWARAIVESVVTKNKNYVELTFPMTKDKAILLKYWKKAAEKIAKEVNNSKEAAFVTIGDPFIYSTYIYLLKILKSSFPSVEVETIPGISAINAASARIGVPLVQGFEKLAVVPVNKDLKGVREALNEFNTVVLMKVGAKLEKIILLLKEMNLSKKAVLISRLGHKTEKIIYGLDAIKDKTVGYLSVIIVRKGQER